MCEFLCRKETGPRFDKGDILVVLANDHSYAPGDLAGNVVVKSPSILISQVMDKASVLLQRFLVDAVSSNLVTDTHRLKIYTEFAVNPGAVNIPAITSALQEWGGKNFAVVNQTLEFDLVVYEALTSAGFWGFNPSGVVFTETGYNQSTGTHTIQADYSATGRNTTPVEIKVDEIGVNIISHSNRVITFEGTRSQVNELLKTFVADKGGDVQLNRRYKFSNAVINQAVANGDVVTITPAQVQSQIIDKTI